MKRTVLFITLLAACLPVMGGGWAGGWAKSGAGVCTWPYWKPIYVDNSGGGAAQAYDIRIALDNTWNWSQFRSDGKDIHCARSRKAVKSTPPRTGSAGQYLLQSDSAVDLSCWVEEGTWDVVAQTGYLWVRYDSMTAIHDTLWVYSGCPGSVHSDIVATFPFGDDFAATWAATTVGSLDNFTALVANPEDTVTFEITATGAGTWASGGVREPSNIIFDPSDADTNRRYKQMICGHRGTYTPPTTQSHIGLAFSYDGLHWSQKADSVTPEAGEDAYLFPHASGDPYYMVMEGKRNASYDRIILMKSTEAARCTVWTYQWTLDTLMDGPNQDAGAHSPASPTVYIEGDSLHLIFEGFRDPAGRSARHVAYKYTQFLNDSTAKYFGDTAHSALPPDGGWEATGNVPDDVTKIGNTYYLVYHGLSVAVNSEGIATAANIGGPYTRVGTQPFARYNTVMLMPNCGNRYAMGNTDTPGYELMEFLKYDSLQVPSKWRSIRGGVYHLTGTFDRKPVPMIYTSGGSLYLQGERNHMIYPSSAVLASTDATWGNGFELQYRMRLIAGSYNRTNSTPFYPLVGFGSDTLRNQANNEATWYRAALGLGYGVDFDRGGAGGGVSDKPTIYNYRYPGTGAATEVDRYQPATNITLDTMIVNLHTYKFDYSAANALRYYIEGTSYIGPNTDATYNAATKSLFIGQGMNSLSTGALGGLQQVDWIIGRKLNAVEPTITFGAAR